MPFSGFPVFLLSPCGMYRFRVRTAPLTDLRHLQGVDRHVYRRQDSSGAGPKTAASELPLLSQHTLPSSEDRAIGASPHERFVASQRTKRFEAASDRLRLVRLPPLTKARLQRFYALSEPDPRIPSCRCAGSISPRPRSQALCLQGIAPSKQPTLSPRSHLPCR